MSVNPEEYTFMGLPLAEFERKYLERRLPTPADLADFVKWLRDMNKWSQETLAEFARIDVRTVQRVENGEPSSLDTRRGLARAFQFEDLDVFNKPCCALNFEKIKADLAELEKTPVVYPITPIKDARSLRTIWEGAELSSAEEIGELSTGARQAFARIVDYLRDYNDVRDAYSQTQVIEVDGDIDALLKTVVDEGAVVGAGLRHLRVRFRSDAPNCEPMDLTIILVVLAPKHALPSTIRAPKAVKFL